MGGYRELQQHPFFEGIVWETLTETEPPKILPFLPSNTKDGESLKSDYDVCWMQLFTPMLSHTLRVATYMDVHMYVCTLTHMYTYAHTLIGEYTYLL